ncbi:Junctional Protein Associated With Coronary Artery Disease [Manis pentadactyla]|nr:Junctional Protein Associated With Coronary Artery Disease [Manis pentadactyla]
MQLAFRGFTEDWCQLRDAIDTPSPLLAASPAASGHSPPTSLLSVWSPHIVLPPGVYQKHSCLVQSPSELLFLFPPTSTMHFPGASGEAEFILNTKEQC